MYYLLCIIYSREYLKTQNPIAAVLELSHIRGSDTSDQSTLTGIIGLYRHIFITVLAREGLTEIIVSQHTTL